ncbi:MAG: S-layer homology domain-containing protein [Candidatus Gracilibacteria bacterium]|jgi:hypothetical protein
MSLNPIFEKHILNLIRFTGVLFAALLASFLFVQTSQAASYTWDGGGSTTAWSECTNWSTDVCPVAADSLTFNATSVEDSVVDAAWTASSGQITALTIASGYSGTLSLSRSLTLSGAFSIAGGTFTATGQTVDFNGGFTITGGTVNAPLIATAAGSFTHEVGGTFNHNNGSWTVDGSSQVTYGVAVTEDFYDFTVNNTQATFGALLISNGDTLVANNNLNLIDGAIVTGTLDAKGSTVTIGADFGLAANGTGTLRINGAGVQTVSIASQTTATFEPVYQFTVGNSNATVTGTGATGRVGFERLSVNFGTVDMTGYTFASNAAVSVAGGTLTLGSGTHTFTSTFAISSGTFNGGSGNLDFNSTLTISGGTFNAASGNTLVQSNFTHIAGGTFAHNSGTVIADGGTSTWNFATSEIFNNFTVDCTDGFVMTISSGDTLIVEGTLNLTDGAVGSGTLRVEGTAVNISVDYDGGTGPMQFREGADQTLTLAAPGDFNADITVNKTAGTVTLVGAMTLNAASQDLILTAGTFDLNGYNVTVNGTTSTMTVASGATLRLQGGETITALATYPSLATGSTVYYDGGSSYTLKDYTYHHLTIDGTLGVFTLAANESIAGNLTIIAGTLSQGGYTLGVTGTVSNDGTLRRFQTEAFTGTMDTDSGTVEYIGNGDGVVDAVTITDFGGTDYYTLKINDANATKDTFTIGGGLSVTTLQVTSSEFIQGANSVTATTLTVDGGTFTGSTGALDINGNVTLSSGTLTAPNGSGSFAVQGNFTKSGGTFTHNSGTVVLDANGTPTLTGSVSWNSLTLQDTNDNATDTMLTVEAGSTQTFEGTLTLDGLDASDRLNIVSSSAGSLATFTFSGSSTFSGDFLDVMDNTLVDSSTGISSPLNPANSVDSGNATNWFVTVILDSIVITDNSGYTNDATPVITISESGTAPTHVAFSCNGGGNWSSWIAYPVDDIVSTFNITSDATGCSATDGEKTISAKIKDASNESSTVSDTTTYDTTAPTVVSVSSSNADGNYGVGEVITVTVQFTDSTMQVTGTPQLELDMDGTNRQASYTSTSTTTLSFTYTVVTGDNKTDLDYTGTGALTLNSGTIKDIAGNTATLTLASPGAAGSLGANKAINVVTNQNPSVASVTGTQSSAGDGDIVITFIMDDADDDNTLQAKIEYSLNGGSSWADPTLSTTGSETFATFGDPGIDNAQTRQVGQTTYITSSSGANTVTIRWEAATDIAASTDIANARIRVTPYDGTIDGTAGSSSDFIIDLVDPTGLANGDFSINSQTSFTLNWTAVTESNFDHYEIWYGTSSSDVSSRSGTALEWDNSDDAALATRTTTSTVLTSSSGLSGHFFQVFAVDDFGNESTVTGYTIQVASSSSSSGTSDSNNSSSGSTGGSSGGGGGGSSGSGSNDEEEEAVEEEPVEETVEEEPVEEEESDSFWDDYSVPDHWSSGYIKYLEEQDNIVEVAIQIPTFTEILEGIFLGPNLGVSRGEATEFLIALAGYQVDSISINVRDLIFSDVDENNPRVGFIQFAYEQMLIGGYPDGSFQPDRVINRAEALKLISFFFGITVDSGLRGQSLLDEYGLSESPFTDIDLEAWYAPFVIHAYSYGVIHGYGDGTFGPANEVSYAEFLKMSTLIQNLEIAVELAEELQ